MKQFYWVALVVVACVTAYMLQPHIFLRWVHITAGITWIGILYYFNFVQVPAMAAATADTNGPGPAAIGKYVAPLALLWFRWAALATWLSGAGHLMHNGKFADAFTLGLMVDDGASLYAVTIGIGAWLGTIMLLNVWALIWPNQKKVLGMVPADDAQKAKAKRIAFLASRSNTLMSVPMLLMMAAASHGGIVG